MSDQHPPPADDAPPRRGPGGLVRRTLKRAWKGSIFSEAAEAAFWQTLSLPPLLLGLLGSLGYVSSWLGPQILKDVQARIIGFSNTIFSDNVVKDIVTPTVEDILRNGRGEVVSIGFLLSLWAGSSAMSSFVDAITSAHDQYTVRNPVWQRIFALLLYVVSLVGLIVGLPLLALGPDILPNFFPDSWYDQVKFYVNLLYYPTVGILALLAVTTLYKLALPRKLPWHRGVPGAVLAVGVFLLASSLLRLYISWITTTGYTYGALATPIALLLFTFFIGFAIVLGAHCNAAIQELWPAKMTRRQRRRWRRLEMERVAEHIRSDSSNTRSNSAPGGDASVDSHDTVNLGDAQENAKNAAPQPGSGPGSESPQGPAGSSSRPTRTHP
nr:YihY/virulence factor BrkB family protein [Kibdelosporangium sp. MJ126-NF4]CEL14714.1 Ribonuclease BN [Kibdelosporangium sp. MJ126-NF4]CTQ96656.1 Ribonuclease BN (EC 3.1.-.-) [Kibdelosporangium sp. MJ126-NF4]